MGFLIDTNIVSELHKGERANARVRQWFEAVDEGDLFISVLTLGEIRNGIERLRRRDPASAAKLEAWLTQLTATMRDHILPIT
ncbi:MAG: PIN domain-containing protein, partial [Chromatiaceae bacterium]|nr:PIN domain-containing protein [Candidatus Thioaporhodococcus sediminis]